MGRQAKRGGANRWRTIVTEQVLILAHAGHAYRPAGTSALGQLIAAGIIEPRDGDPVGSSAAVRG